MSNLVRSLIRWAEERHLPCDVSLGGDIAIFSPDRRHRFVLTRMLGAGTRILAGSGLNPSTANAFTDDPTIRRGSGFGRAWSCALYVMTNAHGFRATDPDDMKRAAAAGVDVVGEHNDAAIAFVLGRLGADDIALAAWGKHAQPDRVQRMRELAAAAGRSWQCLGTNLDGSPRHPLYLKAETPLEAWR